jgi:hypothetical protein
MGRLLVFIVPNINARVRSNDCWGYDHSNKCQCDQKVVHRRSPAAASLCSRPASGSVLSLAADTFQPDAPMSMKPNLGVFYCANDALREPQVEIAPKLCCADWSVIDAYDLGA